MKNYYGLFQVRSLFSFSIRCQHKQSSQLAAPTEYCLLFAMKFAQKYVPLFYRIHISINIKLIVASIKEETNNIIRLNFVVTLGKRMKRV